MTTISAAKKKAWKACSRYIRQKHADSNGYDSCVTCGATKRWQDLDAGHFVPKSRGNRAYFEIGEGPWSVMPYSNVWPQCKGCNGPRGGELIRYAAFIRERYGDGVDVEMVEKLRSATYRVQDYEMIREYCEA